jgi:hypothetical protein
MTAEQTCFRDQGQRQRHDEGIDGFSHIGPSLSKDHSKAIVEELHVVAATFAHATTRLLSQFVITEYDVNLTRVGQNVLSHLPEHSVGHIATMRQDRTVNQLLKKNMAVRAAAEIRELADLLQMDNMIMQITTDDEMSPGRQSYERTFPLGIRQHHFSSLSEQIDGGFWILKIDTHDLAFFFPRVG